MSLPRPLINDILIRNMILMVTCTCVRGSTLARFATVFVLLSIGNTPALRVTLRVGETPTLRVILRALPGDKQ